MWNSGQQPRRVRVTVAGTALAISVLAMLIAAGSLAIQYLGYTNQLEERIEVDVEPADDEYSDIPFEYSVWPGLEVYCPLRLVLVNESERPVVVKSIEVGPQQPSMQVTVKRVQLRLGPLEGSSLPLPLTLQSREVLKVVLWYQLLLPSQVTAAMIHVFPGLGRDMWSGELLALEVDMLLSGEGLDLIGNTYTTARGWTTSSRVSSAVWVKTSEGSVFSRAIDWIPFTCLNGQRINLMDVAL